MYKIGLKLWSTNTDVYYNESIKLYSVGLFDYIELFVIPDSLDTLKQWQILHTQHKIPFIIHCPHSMFGFNLAKPEMFQNNVQIYNCVKQFADALDATYIIFHGGIDGCIEETSRQLSEFNESRALIENKPMIPLSNAKDWKQCRGYNISEIKYILDMVQCGLCLDFGHAISAAVAQNQEPYNYVEKFLALNPKMFHLTDKDNMNNPYDSHLHLGTGHMDLNKIKKMIPDGAFVTLETIKNSKNNLDDFIGDVQCMRN